MPKTRKAVTTPAEMEAMWRCLHTLAGPLDCRENVEGALEILVRFCAQFLAATAGGRRRAVREAFVLNLDHLLDQMSDEDGA